MPTCTVHKEKGNAFGHLPFPQLSLNSTSQVSL